MLEILVSQELRPGPSAFGAGRGLEALGDSQRCVCFSEIPLDLLGRLVARRSVYGVGFMDALLVLNGGARVWYLDKEGSAAADFNALKYQRLKHFDREDPFWRLTPFVDFPGQYGGSRYQFEWEREWRVPRGLHFTTEDVAFLFIPEDLQDSARGFFVEAEREGRGPNYSCPYLDPRWDMERIQEALDDLTDIAAQPLERDEWSDDAGVDENDPDNCPYQTVVSGLCPSCGHVHGEPCMICGGVHGI